MKNWHPTFHTIAVAGNQRYEYVPFHRLTSNDQQTARAAYVYKSVGGKYDFIDEHFVYPVTKDGRLARGRAHRELAIPYDKLQDDAFMASLGYTINRAWVDKMSTVEALKVAVAETKKKYTVHGHSVRRDGSKDSFWTRTRLSKSQASKLAAEQRREGGVAKVVEEA